MFVSFAGNSEDLKRISFLMSVYYALLGSFLDLDKLMFPKILNLFPMLLLFTMVYQLP